MKKIVLLFIIVVGACQLKAQQSFQVKPKDSLSTIPLGKYFNVNPGNPSQFPGLLQGLSKVSPNSIVKNVSPEDHMPIMVLGGNSKMPIVKPGGNYTMPVLHLGSGDSVVTVRKLPAFKTP